jgi:DNA-binding LacI/PurR family transcriptional regulator
MVSSENKLASSSATLQYLSRLKNLTLQLNYESIATVLQHMQRHSLSEIGRRVGVSASTVSRVLNGVSGVNEGTRRKVLAAVQEVNGQAGVVPGPRIQRRLIGFLMPAEAERWGIRTNFTDQGLNAIRAVAADFRYAAMVGSYNPQLSDKAEDEMIANREFAGALLFRTQDELHDSEPFRRQNVPFFIVNRLLPGTSLNYIGPDHLKVGFTAAEHLLKCRYRRIGLVVGNRRYVSHRLYQQGFEAAHAAAGQTVDPALVTEIELDVDGGYKGTRRLMELSPRPDALVLSSDRASLGCLKALSDLKIKVPRDVGVLALDGTRETAFAHPPLTAVEIPWYDMLALATKLLIEMIEQHPPIEQIGICCSTQLVVRGSTAVQKHSTS